VQFSPQSRLDDPSRRIEEWSLTSLRQRLVKTGGRLVNRSRYCGLPLAESHLALRLFGAMLRRIELLPLPAGYRALAAEDNLASKGDAHGKVSAESVEKAEPRIPRCLGWRGTGSALGVLLLCLFALPVVAQTQPSANPAGEVDLHAPGPEATLFKHPFTETPLC